MCNTREENAAELAQEEAIKTIPITRAELIDKLLDDAEGGFDFDQYADALRYGMKGFVEYTNAELEEQAVDWCLLDDDGNEVRYTITDADTSKPSPEAINAELLKALHTIKNQSLGPDWTAEQAIAFIKQHAKAAIAKAEGN